MLLPKICIHLYILSNPMSLVKSTVLFKYNKLDTCILVILDKIVFLCGLPSLNAAGQENKHRWSDNNNLHQYHYVYKETGHKQSIIIFLLCSRYGICPHLRWRGGDGCAGDVWAGAAGRGSGSNQECQEPNQSGTSGDGEDVSCDAGRSEREREIRFYFSLFTSLKWAASLM